MIPVWSQARIGPIDLTLIEAIASQEDISPHDQHERRRRHMSSGSIGMLYGPPISCQDLDGLNMELV